MKTGRTRRQIVLSAEEREQLNAIAASRSLPHGLVRRAHIVLLSAEGNTIPSPKGSASVVRWSESGIIVTFSKGYQVCMTNYAQVGQGRFRMKKSP